MPVLEDEFRVADPKAIDVHNPPSQDKRVVVQAKVRSIVKGNFTNFRTALRIEIRHESDPVLLGNLLRYLAEIAERLHRCERVGFQDQLGFQVVDFVEWSSVRVGGVARDRNGMWRRYRGCR